MQQCEHLRCKRISTKGNKLETTWAYQWGKISDGADYEPNDSLTNEKG
jgi:hypothetical protein